MVRRHSLPPVSACRRGARSLRALCCGPLAALGLLAFAGPAAGRQLTLTFDPPLPTWHEEVRLTVAGLGCFPELSAARVDVAQRIVYVDLFDVCNIVASPLPPRPFELAVTLPPLVVGLYRVRVHDVENGGETSQATLHVYNVTDVSLELAAVPTDAAPPVLRLGAILSCGELRSRVVGQVVEADFSRGCPDLPPPPTVQLVDFPLDAPLPPGLYELRLFDNDLEVENPGLLRLPVRVWDADGCVPSPTRLCLRDGRFAAEATWRDFAERTGAGQAVPLPANEGSGLLWFFAPDNAEITLKVLDACTLNDRWWVFLSSSSTVQYDVTLTDTRTHQQRHYQNARGDTPALVADTEAFPCP
jgi:hypothetical protein